MSLIERVPDFLLRKRKPAGIDTLKNIEDNGVRRSLFNGKGNDLRLLDAADILPGELVEGQAVELLQVLQAAQRLFDRLAAIVLQVGAHQKLPDRA